MVEPEGSGESVRERGYEKLIELGLLGRMSAEARLSATVARRILDKSPAVAAPNHDPWPFFIF